MALDLRTKLAVAAGKGTAALSRRLGRGGGSAVGGKVTLALARLAISSLVGDRRVALISGTNGKTTTTSFVAAGWATAAPIVANITGANLPTGVVSVLASSSADAVLEVDEGHLSRVMAETSPTVVVLLNLSRDQLDRVGEVSRHAGRWRDALTTLPATVVIANSDDPLIAWAAMNHTNVVWVATGQKWRADATSCPSCAGSISWDTTGAWSCDSCVFTRPKPHLTLLGDTVIDHRAADSMHVVDIGLPGWANRANAVMAAAACGCVGVSVVDALAAMSTVGGVAGRYETVTIRGSQARLLLAKNPAGWHELFEVLRPAPMPVIVGINSRIVDGRDPSWLWDVPFERLRGRRVIATGERGRDLVVRLRYADVDAEFIENATAALEAVAHLSTEFEVAANYSNFQQMRIAATSIRRSSTRSRRPNSGGES